MSYLFENEKELLAIIRSHFIKIRRPVLVDHIYRIARSHKLDDWKIGRALRGLEAKGMIKRSSFNGQRWVPKLDKRCIELLRGDQTRENRPRTKETPGILRPLDRFV